MNQALIQIHKQIVELAQEQDSCNAVLGMMLSTAECLSSRFGKVKNERLFNDYNVFGSGDSKNEEYLKAQLRIQTKLFRNNYYYMKKKNNKYSFPENFSKEKIIQIVNIWKDNVSDDKKIYYENIVSIIKDETSIKFPHLKMDTMTNKGIDPNIILDAFLPIMSHVDENLKKVGEDANSKGFYDNKLKVGGQQYDDKGLEKTINNNFQRRGQTNDDGEMYQLMNTLINCFIFGEIYYVLLLKKDKYEYRFYDNKKEIKSEQTLQMGLLLKQYLGNLTNQYKSLTKKNPKSLAVINKFIFDNSNYAFNWKEETKNNLLNLFYETLFKIINDMS
jgi:hypothetical protein